MKLTSFVRESVGFCSMFSMFLSNFTIFNVKSEFACAYINIFNSTRFVDQDGQAPISCVVYTPKISPNKKSWSVVRIIIPINEKAGNVNIPWGNNTNSINDNVVPRIVYHLQITACLVTIPLYEKVWFGLTYSISCLFSLIVELLVKREKCNSSCCGTSPATECSNPLSPPFFVLLQSIIRHVEQRANWPCVRKSINAHNKNNATCIEPSKHQRPRMSYLQTGLSFIRQYYKVSA